MSRPPVNPEKSLAGIALDPITLDRVIPESQRPDGTVRKQIKIRPGFTPQEDVRRFRGTKQAQMDANALPKGHIIGWTPPPDATKPGAGSSNSNTAASPNSTTPMTKAAKKNAKRKEKRERERAEKEKQDVPDNWESDEGQVEGEKATSDEKGDSVEQNAVDDTLSSQLEKLGVN